MAVSRSSFRWLGDRLIPITNRSWTAAPALPALSEVERISAPWHADKRRPYKSLNVDWKCITLEVQMNENA